MVNHCIKKKKHRQIAKPKGWTNEEIIAVERKTKRTRQTLEERARGKTPNTPSNGMPFPNSYKLSVKSGPTCGFEQSNKAKVLHL